MFDSLSPQSCGVFLLFLILTMNFWEVAVFNNTPNNIMIIWDECVYVNSLGQSSRLLRGSTRVIHSDRAQPPSPVAPNSTLRQLVISEGGAAAVAAYPYFTVRPGDPTKQSRIILTLLIDGEKVNWTGNIDWQ